MTNAQSRPSTGKLLVVVVLVAIVVAIIVTLGQNLLLGHSNTAISGAVAGAIAVVVAATMMKKNSKE